jgi:hypothetical protein
MVTRSRNVNKTHRALAGNYESPAGPLNFWGYLPGALRQSYSQSLPKTYLDKLLKKYRFHIKLMSVVYANY